MGRASAVQHRINTGNHRPFKQALRRHQNANLIIIDAHMDSLLLAGLIEPTQSQWASNVFGVRKSDGSMRFCIDYRQLNERTVKDSYTPPRIDICLDALAWRNDFQLLISDPGITRWSFILKRQTRPPLLPVVELFETQ